MTKLIVAFGILAKAHKQSHLLTGFPLIWLNNLNFYPLKCSFGRPLDSANRGGNTTRPSLYTPLHFYFFSLLLLAVAVAKFRKGHNRFQPHPSQSYSTLPEC
jgi:hypothetical protein